jgi:hypothetical protein
MVPEKITAAPQQKALYHSAIFIAYLRLAAYASNHLLLHPISALRTVSGDPISSLASIGGA